MKATLFIVSGAPASGKTTVSAAIADKLGGVPLFQKDWFKEHLFNSVGIGDRGWSRQLGNASFSLLYDTAKELLSKGISTMIEANFKQVAVGAIIELGQQNNAQIIELHCTADHAVIMKRFIERIDIDRHPGHVDAENIELLRGDLEEESYRQLFSDALRIDTTNFSAINYDALVKQIRSRL